MADIKVKITGDNSDLTSSLKDSETQVSSFGASLKGLGSKAAVAGGVTLLGTAVGKVGLAAFSAANDMDTATKQIQAALGVTADQAAELGSIGQDVFKAGFTDSIGEATAAVGITATQLKNITFDELEGATTNALKLSDAFGTDLSGSLNAANVLMSQFGLSQQESFDFLASGFQRGLDTSGDFLDTVSEYGNLFGQAGADAGQFFSVMETGLQGGVLGLDKSADLFKEFQIRILDAGDDTVDALKFLMGPQGINGLYEGLGDGSISMVDAFTSIQQAMSQINDPLQKNTIGVALMGSQFEDMGANAVSGIDTASVSMESLTGSAATLDTQYDTLSAKFTTLGRVAADAFLPVSMMADTVIPAIASAIDAATIGFQALGENESFTRIGDSIVRIGESLGLIPEGSAAAGEGLSGFAEVLGTLETGVQAGVLAIEAVATALETAAGLADQLNTIVGLIQESLGNITAGGLDSITTAFDNIKSAIPDWLIPGSPPPLYWAVQDINKAFDQSPDLSASFGFNNAPALEGILNGPTDLGGSAGANASQGQPSVINLIVDGQIIETIVSGRQGVQRQQQAALGGATRL